MSQPMSKKTESQISDRAKHYMQIKRQNISMIRALKSIRAECNLSIMANDKRECLIVIDSIGRKAQAAIDNAEEVEK